MNSNTGFEYRLIEGGDLVEKYSRWDEPVYEYIPEHARREGMLVTKNEHEHIWSKRKVSFDAENGLAPGHEKALLESMGLEIQIVNWYPGESGALVPRNSAQLDLFDEVYRLV